MRLGSRSEADLEIRIAGKSTRAIDTLTEH